MSFIHRAFLHVIRKKGKSLLLFTIFFILATLALTAISIGTATSHTQSKLRESLGGKFTVWPSMDLKNPYVITKQDVTDGQYSMSFWNTESVYPEMIASIMKTDGIKYYNAVAQWNPDAENFTLCKSAMALPLDKAWKKAVNCIGVSDTEHNKYFTSAAIRLTEGKHITRSNSYTAIISQDLAEKNALKIGDKLQLRTARMDDDAPVTNGRIIELRIIGLFAVQGNAAPQGPQTNYEMIENLIFSDMNSVMDADYGTIRKYRYDEADFVIDDPARLDEIIRRVKAIKLNWVPYEVHSYSEEYQLAAAPLKRLASLIQHLLIIMVFVSACILSLMLTMWIRNRVHETGVLLSMGISKLKIIGQFCLELMLIAVFAFGLSYFSGSAIAQYAANTLLQQGIKAQDKGSECAAIVIGQQSAEPDSDAGEKDEVSVKGDQSAGKEGPDEAEQLATQAALGNTAPVEKITVHVSLQNLLALYGLGFMIIILSVGISSISVMRLKPREILSIMS